MKNVLQQLHLYMKHTNSQYPKYNKKLPATATYLNYTNLQYSRYTEERLTIATSKYTKQANSLLDFLSNSL